MSFIELILLSIGLAVDASCLCTVTGLVHQPSVKRTMKIALPFGIFQGIMPMIGYVGVGLLPAFLFEYDHWIAFGLLAILGGKMIYDALTESEDDNDMSAVTGITFGVLFMQGVSTSIDALAVGVTLHSVPLLTMLGSVTIVAVITYVMCFCAVRIGRAFGTKFNGKAEIIGGIVLILVGLNILWQGFFKGLYV